MLARSEVLDDNDSKLIEQETLLQNKTT